MKARRDVVFVPVALNYDRVLEDRFLIKADKRASAGSAHRFGGHVGDDRRIFGRG